MPTNSDLSARRIAASLFQLPATVTDEPAIVAAPIAFAGEANTMTGGPGDDVYTVDNVGDIIVELPGGGTDTVNASVNYTLGDNVENLNLIGGASSATGNAGNNILRGNTGSNYGNGNSLYGMDGDDILYGEGGNDALYGGEGNDRLDGGEGFDTMTGGNGDDVYVIDNDRDTVIEAVGGGIDTIEVAASFSLMDRGMNVENLIITGSAFSATGNALNNRLVGNDLGNLLDGLAGADRMEGGLGNDTYRVDNAGDLPIEAIGAGYDRVIVTAVSFALAAGQEIEKIETAANHGSYYNVGLYLTGNEFANFIEGNYNDNVLDGGAGDDRLLGLGGRDTLYGGEGNDYLDGVDGADTMIGGIGDDVYVVDDLSDIVTEYAGEGIDRVESAISYSLGANVENLTLTGANAIDGTGNDLNNILIGNNSANILTGGAGNDTLTGGLGNDQLRGGAGDDSYYVEGNNDMIFESAGEGTDTVFSSGSFSMAGIYVENLTLTGTGNTNGTGTGYANVIIGNSGNNILDGGAGADTMIGGLGDDTYVVDQTGDVVTELAGEGNDTIRSSISYALGASNVENLELTGSAAINGIGNAANNRMTGNSANNTLNGGMGNDILDGGAGNDILRGGLGDDTYYVEGQNDTIYESSGEGTDTVISTGTFSMAGIYVENLTLAGTANINGTGTGYANVIIGNSGNNVIDGGGGNDNLYGGLGNDTLIGGAGQDRFYFDTAAGASNWDELQGFSHADDAIYLDRDIFTGIGADGQLAAGAFRAGALAVDADDRILYDSASGNIWYDADGVGGADAVLLAHVTAGTTVDNTDFFGF